MRKVLSTSIFAIAIALGLGVGYGVVHGTGAIYAVTSAYVAEILTESSFSQPQKGGPGTEVAEASDEEHKVAGKNFFVNEQAKKPVISAISYLVADVQTGHVLLSKNAGQQMPIASVTKLMTAIIADETLDLDTKVTVTQQAVNTYGTQGELKKGETYKVSELLYPLLLESSNDAAEALALSQDRESFLADMNAKARSLGMLATSYEDASGLSAGNVSTTKDLFKLVQYIDKYRSYLFDLTTQKKVVLGNKMWLENSKFKNDKEYVGGKNGFTDEALKTQVALFEQDFDGEKREIAYIILRSNDIAYDINLLRGYVKKNVELK